MGQTDAYSGGHAPSGPSGGPVMALAQDVDQALARFPTFDHVYELIKANRDGVLQAHVAKYLRLVSYSPGRITFQPTDDAPSDLSQRLGSKLQSWTGNRWAVIVTNEDGAETIYEKEHAAEIALKEQAAQHPMVQAALAAFPKAKITEVRTHEDLAAEAQADALQEVEDEWDPFEED
jgi:DNA polymerase-3 subunit gamma/tau